MSYIWVGALNELDTRIEKNLPNNINRFVSTDAFLFSGLLVHNSYFSFLFLPQGHLAVFQWRLTLLQNLVTTYFYFEGDPLKC